MYSGRGGPQQNQLPPNQGQPNQQAQFMANGQPMRGNFPSSAPMNQQQPASTGYGSNVSSWDQYFGTSTNSSASNNNMANNNAMKPAPMNNGSMYGPTGNNMAMNANSFPNNNFNPMMSNPMNNANMNNNNFNANNNSMMYSNNNANMMSSIQRGQEYDPYANSNSGYNNNLSANANNLPNNNNNNNPVASAIAEAAAKAFLMRTAGGGNSNVPNNTMNNNNNMNNNMNMSNSMNNPNMNMMNMNPNMGSARPNPMPTNMNMNMNANNNNMSNNNNMMMMKNAGYMNNSSNMNPMNMNLMPNSNNNAFQNNNNMPPNFNNNSNNMNLMNNTNNNNNAMLMNMNAMNNNLNSNKPKTRWSAGLENPLQFPNTFAKQNKPSALFVASLLRHQQYHQQQQQQQQGGAASGVPAAYNPNVGANLPYLEEVSSAVNGGVVGVSAVPVAALLPPEIAPLAAAVLQQQAQQQGVKRDRDTRDTARDTRDGAGRGDSVSRHGRSVSPVGGRSSGRSNNNNNNTSSAAASSSSRSRHGGSRVSRSRSPPISRHTGSASSSGRSHHTSTSGTTSTSIALPHTTSSSTSTSTSVSTVDTLIKHHHFAAFHCVPVPSSPVSHTPHHTSVDLSGLSFSPLDIHWRLPHLFQPASFASLDVFSATDTTTGTQVRHISTGATPQTTRLQDVWMSATQAVPVHYEIAPPLSVGDAHLSVVSSTDTAVVQRVKYSVRVLVSFGVKEHEQQQQQQQDTPHPLLDCHVMRKWRVLTGKPRPSDTSSHSSGQQNRQRHNNSNNNGVSATCVLLGGEYATDCDTPLSRDTATTSVETMRSLLSTARRCVLAQSLLDIMPGHTYTPDTPPLTADGVWVFGESEEETQRSWYKTVVIPMGVVHYNADHKGTFCAEDTPQEPEEGEEASGDEDNDGEDKEEEEAVVDQDTDETQEPQARKRRRVKKSDRHTAAFDEERVALFTVLVLPLERHSSVEEEARFAEQYKLFATRVSGTDPVAQMHQSLGQTQENMKRLLLLSAEENEEVSEDNKEVEEVTYVVEGHRDTEAMVTEETANNRDTVNDTGDNKEDETHASKPEDETAALSNDGEMDAETPETETAATTTAEPTSAQTTQSSPDKAVAAVSLSATHTKTEATTAAKKNVIAKPSQPTVMLAPMANLSLRLLPMSALLSYNLSAPSDRTRDNFETALAAETLVSRFVAQGCVAWIGDVLVGHCVATHWVNSVAEKVKRSRDLNKPTDAANTEQDTDAAVEDIEEVHQMVQFWLETQWQQTFVRYLSPEFIRCVLSLVSHVYATTEGHKTTAVSLVRTFLKNKLAEHNCQLVEEECTSATLLVERFKNACRFMDMAQEKQLSTETLRMVLLTYQNGGQRCKRLSVQEIDRVIDHACGVSHVQYAKIHHGLSGKKNFFHFEYFL